MLPARLLQLPCVMAFGAVAAPLRPHIVYVLLDDWGWADAGWHRPAGEAHGVTTPHMDALVKAGVELNRHYSYKICSPSRTAIQSGRNPIHVSVTNTMETFRNPRDPVSGWSAMPVNMTGLGEVMARGGYATHFYGKWDAGMATPFHSPLGRGYNKSLFYFHHQNDYWTSATQPNESTAGDTTCPGWPKDRGPRDLWEDDHPAWNLVNSVNCTQVSHGGCRYEDRIFADRVLAEVAAHDVTMPLFVFWAPHAVHDPLEVPQEFAQRFARFGPPSGRWERQYYLAIVAYIDNAIGQLVNLLHARNMWKDTLLIVHSDNGGPIYQKGRAGANNWPLRGGKVSNWEGGIRVNAFVSGGMLPESVRGTRSEALTAAWDWYATLAGLAGVSPTDERAAAAGLPPVDSHDLWPLLAGFNATSPRQELAIGTDGLTIGIGKSFDTRVGGLIRGKYKLLQQVLLPMAGWTGPVFPNLTRWDADYTLAVCGPSPLVGCLFDLEKDPEERHNLAHERPKILHEMRARLHELERSVFRPRRGRHDPGACKAVQEKYQGFWGPWAMLDAWPEARQRAWRFTDKQLTDHLVIV